MTRKKKLLALILAVCLLLTSLPTIVFAAEEIPISIPSLPEAPSILNMLSKSRPATVEEYDFTIDLGTAAETEYLIDQDGTYLFYTSNPEYISYATITVAENVTAYISLDNIAFSKMKCAANTNVEIDIIGNVQMDESLTLTGTTNAVISSVDKETDSLTISARESKTTVSLFSGTADDLAKNLWFVNCHIQATIPGAPSGTYLSEVTAENSLCSYAENVYIYDSVFTSDIATYKGGTGGISANNLYVHNSTLDMSRTGLSGNKNSIFETTNQCVITNSDVMFDSTGTTAGCISADGLYLDGDTFQTRCVLDRTFTHAIFSANTQAMLRNNRFTVYSQNANDLIKAPQIHSVGNLIDVFSGQESTIFNATTLKLSDDTVFHYWSSQKRTSESKDVISSEQLDTETSIFSKEDIFETNLSSRSIKSDSQNWFDLLFYCTDGEIVAYYFPQYFRDKTWSLNLKDGYFATNDTQRIKSKTFYIFQILDLDSATATVSSANAAMAKQMVGVAFGYDTPEAAIAHLDDVANEIGCSSEDLFYQSIKTCIEECMKYDGVTFAASDVLSAAEKSKQEITDTYLSVDDKEGNLECWVSGTAISATAYAYMKQYIETLELMKVLCEYEDINDIYTPDGFARYLYIQSFMLFGGGLKDYGGANEVNTTGNAVPLSHILPDGTYEMQFSYGTSYFDTLKVRSVGIGSPSTMFNCEKEMYYLPEGRALKDAGISLNVFPNAFDIADVLKHLPADSVVTGYRYVVNASPSNKYISDVSDFVFQTDDYFEQIVTFKTDTKYCTVRYETNDLGNILNVSGSTSVHSLEVSVPYGHSIEYTEKNIGQVKVHNAYNLAASSSYNAYYFLPYDNQFEITGWVDLNGTLFDFSTPITEDTVITLTPVLKERDTLIETLTISVSTEDNSTEDFAYSYNEPFKAITDDEIQLLNWGYGTDSENYYGKSNSIYIPFTENSQELLYVMGEKFIGTETDGVTSVSGIPNLETANPIKKLKVGCGYTAAVIYANPSDFTAFIPSSVRQFGYIDSSFNQMTPTNAVVYYSYAGNAKAMILEDISSNNLTAQQVAEKYCHYCNDDLEPLSAEEQTATLMQLLADAGLSPMGVVPFEGMTPYTDENDWTVNPDNASEIIGYTGEYHTYIGIPATINGIEIKKVNPMALISSSNVDCGKALGFYVPATVTSITAGYADAIKTMDSSMDVAVAGVDDMSIFSLLPNAYVVVDENNPNYSSFKGSLYNKEKDYLYYLGGGLNETTVLSTVTSFSAYALTISSLTYYNSIAVNKMTFLGTEPVSFNEVTLTVEGMAMFFGGFITTDDSSGEKTISPINFICAKDSPFHQAWLTQVQNWLDENGITDTTAEEGAEFFLTLVDPTTYEDPNLASPGSETADYSDTTFGVININQPFACTYSIYHNNNYTFTLLDIPERYVTPAATQYTINPSISTESLTIHLRLKRGTLNLKTVNADGTVFVANALYEITNTDTGEVYVTDATDTAGTVSFDNLAYGNYTVRQKSVPTGWGISVAAQAFSITEDGQVVNLTFYNNLNQIYSCRIPKTIILDGETGSAAYSVGVKGCLADNSVVTISPQIACVLSSFGKETVTAIISQTVTAWRKSDVQEDVWAQTVGTITAPISAGKWSGIFEFQISITQE